MRFPQLVATVATVATVTLAASLTGCASSHHTPAPSTPAGATAESDLSADTSCQEGDPGCTCVDIDAAAYDDACKVDSDCVAITVGTMCGAASCLPANAAVDKDSYAAFVQDRSAVEDASCVPAPNGTVSCVNDACVLQRTPGSVASGQTDGGASPGDDGSTSAGGDDGTGIEVDLGDDDDTTVVVPDPPSGGDDDGSATSSSGDDDDDKSSDGKRHPHAQARSGHRATQVQSPPVTDILK